MFKLDDKMNLKYDQILNFYIFLLFNKDIKHKYDEILEIIEIHLKICLELDEKLTNLISKFKMQFVRKIRKSRNFSTIITYFFIYFFCNLTDRHTDKILR